MKILSIDPSLTGTAFALLEIQEGHLLSVETFFVDNSKNAKEGTGFRLLQISNKLSWLLEQNQVDHVAIEKQFTRFNVATQAMFRVIGTIELALAQHGLFEIEYITPTSVKKEITGDGKATKEQVQEAVRVYLPKEQKNMEFLTNDCSDAVAIGVVLGLNKKFLKKFKTDVTNQKSPVEKKMKGDKPSKQNKPKRKVKQ